MIHMNVHWHLETISIFQIYFLDFRVFVEIEFKIIIEMSGLDSQNKMSQLQIQKKVTRSNDKNENQWQSKQFTY